MLTSFFLIFFRGFAFLMHIFIGLEHLLSLLGRLFFFAFLLLLSFLLSFELFGLLFFVVYFVVDEVVQTNHALYQAAHIHDIHVVV